MKAATGLSTRFGCHERASPVAAAWGKGVGLRTATMRAFRPNPCRRSRRQGSMAPSFSPLACSELLLTPRSGVALISEPCRCAHAFPYFAVCFTASNGATPSFSP